MAPPDPGEADDEAVADSSRRSSDGSGESQSESTPQEARANSGTESTERRERPPRGKSATSQTGSDPHRELLLDCLENPARGVERLPFVVNLLESEDSQTRLLAALTGCFIAIESDDDQMIEYLVDRLSDRLEGAELSLELTTALDYLTSRYPEQVAHLLDELEGDLEDDMPLPEVGSFTRNYYYTRDYSREGVGRTRLEGEDREKRPREEFSQRLREEEGKREREKEQAKQGLTVNRPSRPAGSSPEGSFASASAEAAGETVDPNEIAQQSRYDEIHVRGRQYRGRYATVYETLVGGRGDERAISLRILGRPTDLGEQRAFDEQLGESLGEWAAVADHEHVVSIWDWGIDPRAWVATSYTGRRMAGTQWPGFESGLEMALGLTSAVSYIHQRDVVHGAIDPKNVSFPGQAFEDQDVDQIPLLDNVGLIHAYSDHFDSDEFLDPRYKAPEYYSDQFGRIDHTTDIYQLGTTCFTLLTGRAPFTGDAVRVQERILRAEPPQASAVHEAIPASIDDVLSKALARQKIRRYETVEHMHQELQSIGREQGIID